MSPTTQLRQEHEVILQVLACLEKLAAAPGPFDAASAGEIVEFLRTFADACHHRKEEELLFPQLRRHGVEGPVGVMLHEHELGRDLVRAMAGAQQAGAAAAFAAAAARFVPLLREHIAKENQVLFPMADRLLEGAAGAELAAGFAATERAHAPGTHQRMLALAQRLCARFGVAGVAEPALPCCQHH